MSRLICGVDTGGTFTDCVVITDGRMITGKVPSTPHDVSIGFFDAIEEVAEQLGMTLEAFVSRLDYLMYGTTVATNMVVERTGARTGLITTRGFTDTLLTMRGVGRVMGVAPDRLMRVAANTKPDPIVPRRLTRGIVERVDWSGEVIVALDEGSVAEAVRDLVAQGIDSLAIACLWSFVNPDHEHRAREIALSIAPDLFVTCSADVAAKWGEYERTAATVINAYVGPATRDYFGRITARARELGIGRLPLILQCGGGAVPVDRAADDAVRTIGSGPTAGVMASRFLGEQLGHPHVICADVGGTTFDVGLVRDGRPVTSSTAVVSQYKYFVPTVDVQSIGAGGGSIAWIDTASNGLRVGPMSAGATPGPACYGRGGTEPTVTDAAVVLGYLSPDFFLGGRLKLDVDAATRAVASIAQPLGMTVDQAAAGIVQIAEFHMADLLRKVTIQRGFDPAEFILYAYGGAGPVHAGIFGRELGVSRIVVPLSNRSSLWSAFGAASSDLTKVLERGHVLVLPASSDAVLDPLESLVQSGRRWLREQGVSEERQVLRRLIDMRYAAQVNEIEIEILPGETDFTATGDIVSRFEQKYEALFGPGSGYRAAGIEITAVRVEASGALPKPHVPRHPHDGPDPEPCTFREIHWPELAQRVRSPIFRGADLKPGRPIAGPAIVEFPDTTLVVHVSDSAALDAFGNVELVMGGRQ